MSTKWMAQLDGGPVSEIPYSRISAYIQATPRNQRKRNADGSLSVACWHFWQVKS